MPVQKLKCHINRAHLVITLHRRVAIANPMIHHDMDLDA